LKTGNLLPREEELLEETIADFVDVSVVSSIENV